MTTEEMDTCEDLLDAARHLLLDGNSLDGVEAVRIGMNLCILAGALSASARAEQKTKRSVDSASA